MKYIRNKWLIYIKKRTNPYSWESNQVTNYSIGFIFLNQVHIQSIYPFIWSQISRYSLIIFNPSAFTRYGTIWFVTRLLHKFKFQKFHPFLASSRKRWSSHICIYLCPSVRPSVRLSVCLSACPSVRLILYVHYPYK